MNNDIRQMMGAYHRVAEMGMTWAVVGFDHDWDALQVALDMAIERRGDVVFEGWSVLGHVVVDTKALEVAALHIGPVAPHGRTDYNITRIRPELLRYVVVSPAAERLRLDLSVDSFCVLTDYPCSVRLPIAMFPPRRVNPGQTITFDVRNHTDETLTFEGALITQPVPLSPVVR